MISNFGNEFKDKEVLVTGGVGFIGSKMAQKLDQLGAKVTIVDSMIPECGGNLFNIEKIKDSINFLKVDIGDVGQIEKIIRDKEFIFNFAGHVSHIDSMKNPHKDLEINSKSQLTLLEACRKYNHDTFIVHLGTRQVYGKISYVPVDEGHPVNPTDINGINKLSGEWFHILYSRVYGMKTVSLRLTNTYGPNQLIAHSKQGFVGWFINRILTGNEIQVFGDGKQKRDFSFVDDVINASLMCVLNSNSNGQIYNIGALEQVSLLDFVELLIKISGKGSYSITPFPEEKKKIDIGSYFADYSKINNEIGWTPQIELKDGLEKTIKYFSENAQHYLT